MKFYLKWNLEVEGAYFYMKICLIVYGIYLIGQKQNKFNDEMSQLIIRNKISNWKNRKGDRSKCQIS